MPLTLESNLGVCMSNAWRTLEGYSRFALNMYDHKLLGRELVACNVLDTKGFAFIMRISVLARLTCLLASLDLEQTSWFACPFLSDWLESGAKRQLLDVCSRL